MMLLIFLIAILCLNVKIACVEGSKPRLPKLIAGNWKMNPVDLRTATKLIFDVAKLTKSGNRRLQILIYLH